MKKIKDISDLSFDNKNINKGSEFGTALLHKSLQEVGAGRSVLADKNGVLIAGNKTIEAAAQIGISKIKVVETKGDEIVVVQRTDLDINSPLGAKAKILDNTVSKHNYVEDAEVAEIICEEAEILNVNSYGLHSIEDEDDDEENDSTVSFTPKAKNQIKISFPNKSQFNQAYKEIASLMKIKFPEAVIKGK